MTDDFEKRARDASTQFIVKSDNGSARFAFIEGTMWARAEMQAEIDTANAEVEEWRRTMVKGGLKIGDLQFEIERLKELVERDIGSSAYDAVVEERDRLKAELERAKGEIENAYNRGVAKGVDAVRPEVERLKLLAVSNTELIEKIRGISNDDSLGKAERFVKIVGVLNAIADR